jgi:hypothetical protein
MVTAGAPGEAPPVSTITSASTAPPRFEVRERRITALEPDVTIDELALSHDGARLAFSARGELWLQDVAGGERVKVGSLALQAYPRPDRPSRVGCCDDVVLDWFPGDRELLVGAPGGPLEALDVRDGARRTVRPASRAYRSVLSPDGTRLATVDPGFGIRIETIDAGDDAVGLPLIPIPARRRVDRISWHPSGDRIAFVTAGEHREDEELAIATLRGFRAPRLLRRGSLYNLDGAVSVAWRDANRLLLTRAENQGGRLSWNSSSSTRRGYCSASPQCCIVFEIPSPGVSW